MKNIIYLTILMSIITNINSFSQDDLLRIYLPQYKASEAASVKKNENFKTNNYYNGQWKEGVGFKLGTPQVEFELFKDPIDVADFIGLRAVDLQQHVADVDKIMDLPSVIPILIVCSVPKDVKEVEWNLPEGIEVVSSPFKSFVLNHRKIVTSVNSSDTIMSVKIENPYLVIGERLENPSNLNRIAFINSNYYTKKYYGNFDKEFRFPNFYVSNKNQEAYGIKHPIDYTYLVIQSNNNGYKKITAQVKNNASSKGSVVLHMNFVNPPEIEEVFDLAFSGGPTISPIEVGTISDNSVDFNINVTNFGNDELDLNEVIFRITSDSWKRNSFQIYNYGFYIPKTSNKILKPKETTKITIPIKDIDYQNLKNMGVAKLVGTALYPSSPENGKNFDLDLTYEKVIIPRLKTLAGIRTKIYTIDGDVRLALDETAGYENEIKDPVTQKVIRYEVSTLQLLTVAGRTVDSDVQGGDSWETELSSEVKTIPIIYKLYKNDNLLGQYVLKLDR